MALSLTHSYNLTHPEFSLVEGILPWQLNWKQGNSRKLPSGQQHCTPRITEMKVFEGNVVCLSQQGPCQAPVKLSYVKEQMSRHITLLTGPVPLTGRRKSAETAPVSYYTCEREGQIVISAPQWGGRGSYKLPMDVNTGTRECWTHSYEGFFTIFLTFGGMRACLDSMGISLDMQMLVEVHAHTQTCTSRH